MLDGRSEALPVSELAGGARIRHIYQDIFVRGLDDLNPSRCPAGSTGMLSLLSWTHYHAGASGLHKSPTHAATEVPRVCCYP